MRIASLFVAVAVLAPVSAIGQDFNLDWFTVDGGGATSSTGGGFELAGTIGQADAGSPAAPLIGGSFELVGGFWAGLGGCSCAGDVNGDCLVNLSDLTSLLSAFGCCQSDPCFTSEGDINHDGCINLTDLAVLLSSFGTPCG